MRTIDHLLVSMSINEEEHHYLKKLLPNTKITVKRNNEVTIEDLKKAEVILGNPRTNLLNEYKNIQLICLQSAGSDAYVKEGILHKKTLLTNATGSFGLAISEYMLAVLLMHFRNLNTYYDYNKEHLWKDASYDRTLYQSKVLVVGLGDIGGDFAKKIKQLGGYTIGIRRTLRDKPDYLDELYTMEELDKLLPMVDVVALSLPRSKETYHLINRERLLKMKKDALLINVGRGTAIELDELVEVMNDNPLFKAALDVTEIEPLPKEHGAWDVKNLLITPHISSGIDLDETRKRVRKIVFTNLENYINEKPLNNIVDFNTGYRKL